jgi:magnesium-transporting ATPase (P-type)
MIVLLLAHFLSDFVFQGNKLLKEKKDSPLKGNLKHASIVFCIIFFGIILSYLYSNGFNWSPLWSILLKILIFSLVNAIIHFVIDYSKSKVSSESNLKLELIFTVVDQVIHVFILYILLKLLIPDIQLISQSMQSSYNLVLYLIIVTFVSGVFIRKILDVIMNNIYLNNIEINKANKEAGRVEQKKLPESDMDSDKRDNTGKLIGIVERSILFLALVLKLPEIAMVIVAFKTLSRYTKLKENEEYYIFGNLLSFLFVLLVYLIYIGI